MSVITKPVKLVNVTRIGREIDKKNVSYLGVIFQKGTQIVFVPGKDGKDVPLGYVFRTSRDMFEATTFDDPAKSGVTANGFDAPSAAERLAFRSERKLAR